MTSRPSQQSALPDTVVGGRKRVYCRRCGRQLLDAAARERGYGRECDPLTPARRSDTGVDQDPIPGT